MSPPGDLRTSQRRLSWTALFGAATLLSAACGGPRIAGGHTVPQSGEPDGLVDAEYSVEGCRDGAGTKLPLAPSAVRVLRPTPRSTLLVERRPAYESIVVNNSFLRHGRVVFQVAFMSDDGRPLLREYDLGAHGGTGRLAVTDRWEHVEKDNGFEGHFREPLFVCELVARQP